MRGVMTRSPTRAIHPGQLHAGLAGRQQAVRVHANAESRARSIPADDLRDRVLEDTLLIRCHDGASFGRVQ